MAKRKPTLTLMEMERKLGYNINSLNYPDEGVNCFYSDLRPVPQCIYDTKNEVLQAMTVLKLQPNTTRGLGPMFFKLPKELRDKIYVYALPEGEWKIGDVDSSNELNFAGGIGDPSGFYFPLSSLNVLRLNRQIRQEALPFAYRRTVFHLDDMDDLIKLLIAVGNIGREYIESLELAWQSRTDFECQWAEALVPNEHSLTLPTLHVAKCVQLLKQCKSLRFLRLYFDSDLILGMSPTAYKTDLGLCELRSVRGIERVEIWDLGYEPLEQCGFVKWLKEAMESSEEDEEDKIGAGKYSAVSRVCTPPSLLARTLQGMKNAQLESRGSENTYILAR